MLRATLALDFMAFTEFAFGVVRPNTLFKPNWHLEALAHKLSQVAAGEVRRLIVTMPPRNLKSLFASVALPAWFLGHNPSERVVTVSYSDQLARTHANDFRRLVNDPLYQATFPAMRLARDTEREIVTTMRGKRYTTSIEGTLTGLGGNLVIIDDPLKQEDAHSEAVRRRTIEWYRSTLLSRPDDKQVARILLVMQRVHQDDLAGYLEEQGGFEILNLPAIATQTRTYELGGGRSYVRQQGELLHPSHEPESVLRELKREMGPIAFSAQYQQSPIPPGGTIIKRKWFVFYDAVPTHAPGDQVIMSWDIAFSEQEKGDYSAVRRVVAPKGSVLRSRSHSRASAFRRSQAQDFGGQKTLWGRDAADRGLAHQQGPDPKPRGEFDQRHQVCPGNRQACAPDCPVRSVLGWFGAAAEAGTVA